METAEKMGYMPVQVGNVSTWSIEYVSSPILVRRTGELTSTFRGRPYIITLDNRVLVFDSAKISDNAPKLTKYRELKNGFAVYQQSFFDRHLHRSYISYINFRYFEADHKSKFTEDEIITLWVSNTLINNFESEISAVISLWGISAHVGDLRLTEALSETTSTYVLTGHIGEDGKIGNAITTPVDRFVAVLATFHLGYGHIYNTTLYSEHRQALTILAVGLAQKAQSEEWGQEWFDSPLHLREEPAFKDLTD
jgi:hypothetical protein